eukprot:Platyproteum_vivax@DN4171_c0_g1_i1.p1
MQDPASSKSTAEVLKEHQRRGRPSHEEIMVLDGAYPVGEHPLETAWTLWYDVRTDRQMDAEGYASTLKAIGEFNTIEGFYRHFCWLHKASSLPRNTNIFVFRKGCIPMWEEFPEGGSWIVRVKKTSRCPDILNKMWEDLVLACICESFEMPEVVGVVLALRKDDILAVWNDCNHNSQVRFSIGEKLKGTLALDQQTLIQYKDFMTAMRDSSSFANAKNYMFSQTPHQTPANSNMLTTPPDHLEELPASAYPPNNHYKKKNKSHDSKSPNPVNSGNPKKEGSPEKENKKKEKVLS